jgi:hypothetical protein
VSRQFGKTHIKRWDKPEWVALSVTAQWLYDALVSNANLSQCGAMEWKPKQMKKLAGALSLDVLESAMLELREGLFVVLDEDVDVLLVRSFIRNDVDVSNKNMMVSVIKAWQRIGSMELKRVVIFELARLRAEQPDQAIWAHKDMLAAFQTTPPLDPQKFTGYMKPTDEDPFF